MTRLAKAALAGLWIFACCVDSSHAERIENPVAVFSGMDKITAVTQTFQVKIGEEVSFGTLTVKAFACYTRSITEKPKTTGFVQIFSRDESGVQEKLFSGWMFAESPGLSALENPVYDVWLTGCIDPAAPPPPVELPPLPAEAEVEKTPDEPQD